MTMTDDHDAELTAIADAMLAASQRRLAAMRDALPIPMTPRIRTAARRRSHSRRHRAISSRS